jgi:hypothetical protein
VLTSTTVQRIEQDEQRVTVHDTRAARTAASRWSAPTA